MQICLFFSVPAMRFVGYKLIEMYWMCVHTNCVAFASPGGTTLFCNQIFVIDGSLMAIIKIYCEIGNVLLAVAVDVAVETQLSPDLSSSLTLKIFFSR